MSINISNTLKNKIVSPVKLNSEIYSFEKDVNGLLNIKKNGRYIHSKYSSENECRNILNTLKERENINLIIFYGLGLFRVLLFLCENYSEYLNKKVSILAVIEDSDIFNYVYFNLLSDENKLKLSELDIFFIDKKEAADFILKLLNKKYISNVVFIALPSLTKEEKTEANNFHISFLKAMELNISNTLTNMNFETIWTRNILFNSLYLENSADVSCFKNVLKGFNLVLICAGPTLENSIGKLKEQRENILIIAIDTAYNILMKNNIIPDFVLTSDAGFYNVFDFTSEYKSFPYLVMDLSVHKLIPYLAGSRADIITFTSNENVDIIKVFKEKTGVNISSIFMTNTAATAMIDFANFLGVKKILLIGFDNNYTYYYRHIKHTLSYEIILSNMNKLNTIESFYFDSVKYLLTSSNSDIKTNYIFEKQVEYLETISEKYSDMEIMRITSEGKKIENIKEGTIDDIVIETQNKNAMIKLKNAFKKNDVLASEIKKIYIDTIFYIEKLKEEIKLIESDIFDLYKKNYSLTYALLLNEKLYKMLENYYESIPILKSIISSSITLSEIMSSHTKEDILSKTNFLIKETVSTLNYFHTRLNIILKK